MANSVKHESGNRQQDGFEQAAGALERAEHAALFVTAGKQADVLEHRRPEDADADHAPECVNDQQLFVARDRRVPGVGPGAGEQRDDHQFLRCDPVRQPAAGQVADHRPDRVHAAQVAELGLGQRKRVEQRGLEKLAKIRRAVDDRRGKRQQEDLDVGRQPVAADPVDETIGCRDHQSMKDSPSRPLRTFSGIERFMCSAIDGRMSTMPGMS